MLQTGLAHFSTVLILLFVGFLPTLIAFYRHHHQRMAIFVLNAILGVTVIGWIIALVWAATAVVSPTVTGIRSSARK